MIKKGLTTLVILLVISVIGHGESYKVKQFRQQLATTTDPGRKAEIMLKIADELRGSDPDSALAYYASVEKISTTIRPDVQRKTLEIKCLLGRTSISTIQGRFKDSHRFDSLALLKAREIGSYDLEAQALMSKGSIYYHQSDFDNAQKINYQALKLVQKAGNPKTEGKILTNIGTIEFIVGNTAKADSFFRIPIAIATRSHDDDLLAAAYVNIGQLNLYRGNYTASEEFALKAVEVYKGINGIDGLALCYQNLSNIYIQRSDFRKAIEYNLLASKYFSIINDVTGKGSALHNLGECYVHIGDYEQAMNYFLQALKLRKSANNQQEVGSTMLSLGHLHYRLSNLAMAKRYYRDAEARFQRIGYALGIANAYDAAANIFLETGDYDSAMLYNEKAAAGFYESESYVSQASSWLDIGRIYLIRNDFAKAEAYYMKALEVKEQAGDSVGLNQALSMLATYFTKLAEQHPAHSKKASEALQQAHHFASRAYQLGVSTQNLPAQIEASGKLIIILEKDGRYQEALRYAKTKIETTDSLHKFQRSEALANAEIRWEAQQKQEEINLLVRDRDLQQRLLAQILKSSSRLRIIIGAFLVIAVLLTFSLLMLRKNLKRKKEIEYQLHLNEVTRLRMQNINNRLSPHLLFNLLGSVSSDEASSTGHAGEKIRMMAHLLRRSLESTEKMAIPLHDELDMVRSYLWLQSSRIEGGIEFSLQIDPALPPEVLVPAMAIQIPAENAIKHGLLPHEGEKRLTIRCSKSDEALLIEIHDNGIGRQGSTGRTKGTGTGLKSLLQTIRLLNRSNKEQITFSITDPAEGGTLVRLSVPLQFNYL